MARKWNLIVGCGMLLGGIAYVAYLGAFGSWQYYVLVDECVAAGPTFQGKRLRVSGKVQSGTLHVAPERRAAHFVLQGATHQLPVACAGLLPDNLAEGIDVVVEGTLQPDGRLAGQRVLTRCASKYAAEPTQLAGTPSAGISR